MAKFYPHVKMREMDCKGQIEKWIQYRITASDIQSDAPVPYLLDFMKIGSLWITDIYPEMWAEYSDRCRRLTSHENIHINFERISNTSVKVFLEDFPQDGSVMVISGSYQDDEEKEGDSRRLCMYRYFFNKLKKHLPIQIIEIPETNGFFISHADAFIDKLSLIQKYKEFRASR